jgi:acyl-CoA:6-aminopenicillanic acid acyl transferase/Leucine Rich Repeat (LRR) protein
MERRLTRALASVAIIVLILCSCSLNSAADSVVVEDRVLAGGPSESLEVRHIVLRGTNEQIGRALAEIAKERYGVRLEPSDDPMQVRAQRKYLERNNPILLERMRGVAQAFGKSIDDDGWDFASALGFTDLKAGCSIAHLPPQSTANGKSVVSRDYDFTTGALSWSFLPPGMLHPTARPYVVELHPDRGYASIAMVAYDLLSGVLDGINSEGLTVTLAMDDEQFSKGKVEPTRHPAVGLGELQTLRLVLDTCATVEEAKEALLTTKQYYQYVPVHYLIADRNGKAFVWEYSEQHNKEYIVESPGEPLVMTNFTIHKYVEDGKPPSAQKASAVCRRYQYLKDKLAVGSLDDKAIRGFHQACDAQLSQEADPSRPPERTFWHVFYYPEDRRARMSFYLHDEPIPGDARHVRPIRTDYIEFKLDPTEEQSDPTTAAAAPAARAPASAPETGANDTQSALEAAGVAVKRDGKRITSVSLGKSSQLDAALPLLAKLPDLEELGLMDAPIGDGALEVVKSMPKLRALNIGGTRVTDAGLQHVQGLTSLEYLGVMRTQVSDAGLANLKNLPSLKTLNLADTKVTDEGLVHLFGLKRLEGLNLSNNAITDAGLVQVGKIPSVAGLNLTGTKVTDAGLVHLASLPKLTKLNLTGTAVTEEGVKQAKKSLPFWLQVTR